jgi:hypothetical protein
MKRASHKIPASEDRSDPKVFFERLPRPQRGLAEALRRIVLSAAPGIDESIMWGNPWYGKGAGMAGAVCYISVHKNHVNFGFPQGASLTDAGGVLEGTGKGMRHVKIRSKADTRPDLFSAWVREALALTSTAAGAPEVKRRRPPARKGRSRTPATGSARWR